MRNKVMVLILTAILTLTGVYVYADRSLLALQIGLTLPLQWEDPYGKQEEPIMLTTRPSQLSEPRVSLTPLYYLPESKKLQFGLGYSKHKYQADPSMNIPDRIFHVTVRDADGQIFDKDTVIKTTGLFDEFQRRSINVDLDGRDSIEINVAWISQDGNVLTPIESSSFKVVLEE
ncbi:hypothetical protein [Saccharibacillus sacchari]|uniref:hypothetical protein n=1 Tax=Saccharibacillus sacchari TaxID=456493 RepID=UPI0004BBF36D|nr:hypothetical protein [Saccharibacillus sacchari]